MSTPADPQRRAQRFEAAVRADQAARHGLRWPSFWLATACFLAAWALSAALMHAGLRTLVLRRPRAVAGACAVFIGLPWLWCRWLPGADSRPQAVRLLRG